MFFENIAASKNAELAVAPGVEASKPLVWCTALCSGGEALSSAHRLKDRPKTIGARRLRLSRRLLYRSGRRCECVCKLVRPVQRAAREKKSAPAGRLRVEALPPAFQGVLSARFGGSPLARLREKGGPRLGPRSAAGAKKQRCVGFVE